MFQWSSGTCPRERFDRWHRDGHRAPCVLLTSFLDALWCPVLFVLPVSCDSPVRPLPLAQVKNNSQSITHHGSGACVTESMSVHTDPATYGILNSELTNCPRTAAVLGELAAQWQQMMGTLQRVEQDALSSQSLANAIESIGRTRTEATAGRLRLKDGERLYPKSLVGQHTNWRLCMRGRCVAGIYRPGTCGWKADSADHGRERSERQRRGLTVAMLKTTSVLSWTVS